MKTQFPARPTLTAPFTCSVFFWAACAFAYSSGSMRPQGESAVIAGVCALIFLVALAMACRRRAHLIWLVVASCSIGAMLGCAQGTVIHADARELEGLSDETVELKILEDSANYGYGESALVELVGGQGNAVCSAHLDECGPLLAGERIRAHVSFSPIDYSADDYAWRDGSCGKLSGRFAERVEQVPVLQALIDVRKRAIEGIGSQDDAHALLQALVCGYRRNVRDTELYTQFQTCGLAHLVAVSGAHLVIVTGLFASLLRFCHTPRMASIAVLVSVMVSYYIISGMPVSALRATVMSALGLLSYFGKRRPSSLNAIGIGLFAIVTASPASSVSASLALSALSTIGIVLFAPLVQAWLAQTPIERIGFVSDALSLTVAASLLSQLYACSLFDLLPLVAPLANVVTAPLFPLVCGSGLAFGLGSAAFGWFPVLGSCASALSNVLAAAVGMLSSVPFSSVPFSIGSIEALSVTALVTCALWIAWPRPRKEVGFAVVATAVLVIAAFAIPVSNADRIVMFDVGQGDAIFIQSRGDTLLIDTGNQDAKLLRELALNRIVSIDSVLITHADDDHCGSLDQLERTAHVDRVLIAHDMLECVDNAARDLVEEAKQTAPEVVGLELGDSFSVGAFTARVIWPRAFSEDGGNADSLCVLLEYDGNEDGAVDYTALMTGDAEKDQIATMIQEGLIGDIDILKVGHHGSKNGTTEDEMHILNPEIALISCGAHNRYGHPTQVILDMLENEGARIMRTDQDGEVTCTLTPDSITISCRQI